MNCRKNSLTDLHQLLKASTSPNTSFLGFDSSSLPHEEACVSFMIKPPFCQDVESSNLSQNDSQHLNKFSIKIKPINDQIADIKSFSISVPILKCEDLYLISTIQNEKEGIESDETPFSSYLSLAGKKQDACQCRWNTFVEFTKARYRYQKNSRKNLYFCNLKEVLQLCFQKRILSKDLWKKFYLNFDSLTERIFLAHQLRHHQLLNMKKCLFTLVDYRYFCSALIQNFPSEYFVEGKPMNIDPTITAYFNYLYSLTEEKYQNIIDEFNKQHNRFWMPKKGTDLYGIKLKNEVSEISEEKEEMKFLRLRGRKLRKTIGYYWE